MPRYFHITVGQHYRYGAIHASKIFARRYAGLLERKPPTSPGRVFGGREGSQLCKYTVISCVQTSCGDLSFNLLNHGPLFYLKLISLIKGQIHMCKYQHIICYRPKFVGIQLQRIRYGSCFGQLGVIIYIYSPYT